MLKTKLADLLILKYARGVQGIRKGLSRCQLLFKPLDPGLGDVPPFHNGSLQGLRMEVTSKLHRRPCQEEQPSVSLFVTYVEHTTPTTAMDRGQESRIGLRMVVSRRDSCLGIDPE
jgi:hypothetical protein